ncbi:YciI family protein [Haloactinopolyspora sp.]|uniref:YciI family protein n=1 Tax=Haloactinopolyspora sp. TaxID=1966353 RepID=UPI002615D7A8|nr:YciI family protein [Haloactinopolyspora sp.]
MKYLMLICGPDTEDDPETVAAQMKQITAWMDAQHAAGAIAHPGYQLHPSTTARTIRSSGDGTPMVTDGPFIEAQEVIGGLIVLEHDTIDRAVEAASEWVRINPAWSIEIRPVLD